MLPKEKVAKKGMVDTSREFSLIYTKKLKDTKEASKYTGRCMVWFICLLVSCVTCAFCSCAAQAPGSFLARKVAR